MQRRFFENISKLKMVFAVQIKLLYYMQIQNPSKLVMDIF